MSLHGPYMEADAFTDAWAGFALRAGARASVAGRSVEGREIPRYDFGSPDASRTVLLTALLHGVEVIGSVALLRALEHAIGQGLHEHTRLVVMPIANPDAYHANMRRVARGRLAGQRGNARGVDLNRNFPWVASEMPWHPFAGSRKRWSPHYVGPHPLSEPESQAIAKVASALRPDVSIGFHSFGDMLLYPWAHTRAPNPRVSLYRTLGARFGAALEGASFSIGQATQLYPTIGDLDDWLDAELGTLAFTVEVSSLDRRLLNPRRLVDPFCWMNPTESSVIESTVEGLAPAVVALLSAAPVMRARDEEPLRPSLLAAR